VILNSICLEGWRCFARNTYVGPFTDGLNIISGPNGSGKSTLIMALVRGLFDSHLVTGENVSGLRPWGRSLNPRVTLEFTHDAVHYRLHKQFLTSQSAILSRLEKGDYVPLAESRAADEQARRLLAGDAPGRGVSDQRHWGLAQILWATQGNLRIDELASGTRATLQEALGAQIAGPATDVVERRIADAYGQFFTRTGKLKGGASAPATVRLQSEIAEAEQSRKTLQRRLEEFETASRRIEDLRFTAAASRNNEMDLAEQLRQARERTQVYRDLRNEQKLRRQEVQAAETCYAALKRRINDIADRRSELGSVNQQLQRLRDDAPAQTRLVAQCRQRAQETRQAVESVRARRGEVTAARQLAAAADRLSRLRERLMILSQQIQDIELAQSELDALRTSHQGVVAPDARTLTKIKKTARTRDDARLQLDAALITVTVEPDADIPVQITAGEEPGLRTFEPGHVHLIRGAPEVAFRIEGVGNFRASGPTGSVDELREKWEKSTAAFQELISRFGTNDLDELDSLQVQAAELSRKIESAEVRMATLLGGRQFNELQAEFAQSQNARQDILAVYTEWEASPPDPEQLSLHAAEVEQHFVDAIDSAEADNDRAQETLNRTLEKQTTCDAEIKNVERKRADLQTQIDSLCDDAMDDGQRATRLTELALQHDAARGKLDILDKRFAEFGDDPEKTVTVLEGQLNAVRAERGEAEKGLNTEKGRLEQITSDAPYSALVVVEEQIDQLRDELARQQLHIDAIRLVYETVQEQKQAIMQAVAKPVRLRANQILQRIIGGRFEDICFDESLLPIGVAPRSLGVPVSLDDISGGEREQLYFAVRLALAAVAFGDERQLVVLDDVFTYTDTPRLARIASILEEAAEQFQVILLTCHPERYRGLPKATFFDMETIVATGA
jgi:DNA repair exonuclease SbcCD ATPase subunit